MSNKDSDINDVPEVVAGAALHADVPDRPEKITTSMLSAGEAASLEAAWRDLCNDLIEENPFFEPWALLPALREYADEKVSLICVWAAQNDSRKLVGLLPVTAQRGYANLPVSYWATWMHPHCYFATPLIRRGYAKTVYAEIFELLCSGSVARSFLRLRHMDEQSALTAAAGKHAAEEGRLFYKVGGYQRAALFAGVDAAEFLEANIRKKKRKELNRLRKRMEEIGEISTHILTGHDQLGVWTDEFLALEHKSWKGEQGTSLCASPQDTAWFHDMLKGAFGAGKLQFLRLDCGGRPAAMLANIGASAGYSIKICHDPEFARFSPGVMIEIEATKRLLNEPGFSFMDSCAARDHPMINSLWNDRREITGLNISGKSTSSKLVLRLCQSLELLRAKLPNDLRPTSGKGAVK